MKQLLLPANATFNATAKTITFATTIPASISHILHVTNVTRGVLYFQPQAGAAFTGTFASPVLTLACSTSGHADADKLEIFYDDGTSPLTDTQLRATAVPVSVSGVSTETTLAAQSTLMGAVNETAPASDTASSGINGRLQRIAQRLTSLLTTQTDRSQKTQITDGTNDVGSNTDVAAAGSTTTPRLRTASVLMSYNGGTTTGIDAVRSGFSAVVSAFTGFLNTVNFLKYNSTPPTLTDGQGAPLQGDSAGNLKVTLGAATVPVSSTTVNVSTAVTNTVASAYVSGDCVGSLITFANAARVSTGTLWDITIQSKSAQSVQFDLFLFHTTPSGTTVTDSGAVAIAAADYNKLVGAFSLTNWVSGGTASVCTLPGIGKTFAIPSGTSLFGILVTRGAPTIANGDFTVVLGIAQD